MPEYIYYNSKTESLELSLPDEHKKRTAEILEEIMDEFGFESITPGLIMKMNQAIEQKLSR